MEDIRFSHKHNLKLILVLRDAIGVSVKNPSFAIASLLSSIPLLCFSVLYFEPLLERVLVQTQQILGRQPNSLLDENLPFPLCLTRNITGDYSNELILLGILWLVRFHLLELYPVMIIIRTSSVYFEDNKSLTIWESMRVAGFAAKFRRLLVTSVYITFFSICFVAGSVWLVAVYTVIIRKLSGYNFEFVVAALYRAASVGLLSKWLQISAVMNTSMVISILKETSGAEALMLSARMSSRGNGPTNFLLCLVLFVLVTSSRLACLGARCGDRLVPLALRFCLLHFVNVVRWVSFTVSFHTCEDRRKTRDDEEAADDRCKIVP